MKRSAKRSPGTPKAKKPASATSPAPKRRRRRFTPAERENILSAAKARGLTAKQVQKEFGVTPVTFYLWRRNAGLSTGRSGPATTRARVAAKGQGHLPAGTREQVRRRVREQLDVLIGQEVEAYLNETLGSPKTKR